MSSKPKYKLAIEINGGKLKTEGSSVLSCFNKLKVQSSYKTMAYLSVSNGKETARKMLKPLIIKRLIGGSEMMREAFAKKFTILLGE